MLIQIQNGSNGVKSINVNQIIMIEPGHQSGTYIHVRDMDKIHTPEDYFELERRIKSVFRQTYPK
ncbi:hypothetical protein EG339_02765 [Chryseobacterium bernardetii]|uniref:Uncharacterized protein n=1 Tax=Chryseobacterium bernardetii TaxID=1241978 RepID=A0A3G6T6W9_9FLAO|nr:hypothetical protein EG339_02765 [Chryseobacterium bernardetii]